MPLTSVSFLFFFLSAFASYTSIGSSSISTDNKDHTDFSLFSTLANLKSTSYKISPDRNPLLPHQVWLLLRGSKGWCPILEPLPSLPFKPGASGGHKKRWRIASTLPWMPRGAPLKASGNPPGTDIWSIHAVRVHLLCPVPLQSHSSLLWSQSGPSFHWIIVHSSFGLNDTGLGVN